MQVEAARAMLIFSRAPLYFWAEAIATACYTQNRSIIHRRFDKPPYELINGRKPDISFLHVFGALCYPKNNREDIRKLGEKGDISFFIGYSDNSCAYRVYNRRTKKIIETMNVTFDDLSVMVFEQSSLKSKLQSMTSKKIGSRLDLTYAPLTITTQQPTECEFDLLFEAMYDDHIDADYTGCKDTFKSTSGGAQFLGEKLVPAQSVRSSNAIALDSSYLLVLISGTSQSKKHDKSESRPTAELFDVNSGRISIVTVNTKEYHSNVLELIKRIIRRTLDNSL
uniref:Retroviral polymerase SH3-like domain-containing protein n=1 Tax=Tanacetum cinerariifolium TaxID=118510 RepID=A0A6L2KCQ5_TANCI|nr:hypothetical protein [Tanacetum cinerariifolium]